jgi:hypothetical protein
MTPLHRLLELVRRELGASDARAEVGGRDPEDPRLVHCRFGDDWRLVACFDTPPPDPNEVLRRLRALAESFSGVTEGALESGPAARELAVRRLDDELEALIDRAGATSAVVIDAQSPVIWGASGAHRGGEDVDTTLKTAEAIAAADSAGVDLAQLVGADPDQARLELERRGLERDVAGFLSREAERLRREGQRSGAAWRRHLLTCRAIAAVRRRQGESAQDASHLNEIARGEDWAYLVRAFATIYCVILVFDSRFSELHAEAALVHALPLIERLVLALPPVEPPPKPGKVVRLRPSR